MADHTAPALPEEPKDLLNLNIKKSEAMMLAKLFSHMQMLMIANPSKYGDDVMVKLQGMLEQLDVKIHEMKWCDNPNCSFDIAKIQKTKELVKGNGVKN